MPSAILKWTIPPWLHSARETQITRSEEQLPKGKSGTSPAFPWCQPTRKPRGTSLGGRGWAGTASQSRGQGAAAPPSHLNTQVPSTSSAVRALQRQEHKKHLNQEWDKSPSSADERELWHSLVSAKALLPPNTNSSQFRLRSASASWESSVSWVYPTFS